MSAKTNTRSDANMAGQSQDVSAAMHHSLPEEHVQSHMPSSSRKRALKLDFRMDVPLGFPLVSMALVFVLLSFLPINWCAILKDSSILVDWLKFLWPSGIRIAASMQRAIDLQIGCLYVLYLPFVWLAVIVSTILTMRYMQRSNLFVFYEQPLRTRLFALARLFAAIFVTGFILFHADEFQTGHPLYANAFLAGRWNFIRIALLHVLMALWFSYLGLTLIGVIKRLNMKEV